MRRVFALVVVVLMLAPLVGVAQEDILIIGTTDRVTELSFANSYDFWTWHVLRNTAEGLVGLEPRTHEIVPAIAESWEISEDGLVYTFYIRPGVTFWDGETCDAHAVKWSLDRTMELDGPTGGVGLIKPIINEIEVIDDLTVQITLNYPDSTFLIRMTNNLAPSLIYSPESTPEDEFARGQFAATGPYKLVEYKADERIVYEAYEGYWGDTPKTERIVEVMYADMSALRAAIESGDIDIAFRTLGPEDILDMEDNPSVEVKIYEPSPGVRYLLFNVTQPPVDNVLVRQAITYAVDREALCSRVFADITTPIYSMVPDALPPANSSVDAFPKRDCDKARELLSLAGYSEDNPLELNLWWTPKHYGTTEADVAAVLKDSIEDCLPARVSLESLEWGAYVERMSEGGFDMFLLGWHPDYLEASNFLAPWTTESPEGMGTYFNHHPNYDAYKHILEVAAATVDEVQRAKLYQAVQMLSAYDVPWIPLWSMTDEMVVVTLPGVEGAFLDLTMDLRLSLLERK
ncbi:MAG: ABC transporter substrate-binding protein [Candidatus Bipolaricaulota bacterium]